MIDLLSTEAQVLQWTRWLADVAETNAGPDSATWTWRYRSVADLLLDQGRWFRWARSTDPLGTAGRCFENAQVHAEATGLVYVEGLAAPAGGLLRGMALEHAWCAQGADAVETTWSDGGMAFLGIPFTPAFLQARQNRSAGEYPPVLWTPTVLSLLQHGIPSDAIASIGVGLGAERTPPPFPTSQVEMPEDQLTEHAQRPDRPPEEN